MPTPFPKLPGEARIVTANYVSAAEIVAGATLVSAVVTADPSGLTIGTPAVSSNQVNFLVSGGTDGTIYTITCLATTNDSAIIGAQVKVQCTNLLSP